MSFLVTTDSESWVFRRGPRRNLNPNRGKNEQFLIINRPGLHRPGLGGQEKHTDRHNHRDAHGDTYVWMQDTYRYRERKRGIEREREGERKRARKQERKRDRETERQRDRVQDRERERDRQTDGQTDGQTDWLTDWQTDRQKETHIHRKRPRHIHTDICTDIQMPHFGELSKVNRQRQEPIHIRQTHHDTRMSCRCGAHMQPPDLLQSVLPVWSKLQGGAGTEPEPSEPSSRNQESNRNRQNLFSGTETGTVLPCQTVRNHREALSPEEPSEPKPELFEPCCTHRNRIEPGPPWNISFATTAMSWGWSSCPQPPCGRSYQGESVCQQTAHMTLPRNLCEIASEKLQNCSFIKINCRCFESHTWILKRTPRNTGQVQL